MPVPVPVFAVRSAAAAAASAAAAAAAAGDDAHSDRRKSAAGPAPACNPNDSGRHARAHCRLSRWRAVQPLSERSGRRRMALWNSFIRKWWQLATPAAVEQDCLVTDSRHPLDGSLPAEEFVDICQAIAMELHPPPLPLPVLPPPLLLLRQVSFIA